MRGPIPMPEPSEETLRQYVAYLDVLESQMEALTKQVEMLTIAYAEHERALTTLEAVRAESEEALGDTLVPIGAQTFVPARVRKSGTVLVTLGAGVVCEKGIDEAYDLLESRKREIIQQEEKLRETIRGVEAQRRQVQAAVDEMYGRAERDIMPGA